jgi:beta-galactosidase GanA
MKLVNLTTFLCLGVTAFAQDVQFDYDRSVNFNAYKTYQWVDYTRVDVGDQLLDRDIKRAVDEQLAAKGLRRVESGGDLLVGYEAGITQEKEYESLGGGWGGPWWGPWGNWGDRRVTSSTIDVGKLVIGLFDPAIKQLVWRGFASKTLDLKKDPDKNYQTLEKAMAKLFKNYPPGKGRS